VLADGLQPLLVDLAALELMGSDGEPASDVLSRVEATTESIGFLAPVLAGGPGGADAALSRRLIAREGRPALPCPVARFPRGQKPQGSPSTCHPIRRMTQTTWMITT